jgi:hypothetical protein
VDYSKDALYFSTESYQELLDYLHDSEGADLQGALINLAKTVSPAVDASRPYPLNCIFIRHNLNQSDRRQSERQ